MTTFNKLLKKGDRRKMRRLQHELGKPIQFKDLPDFAYFTVGHSKEVYQKQGNSHSTSTKTQKDAIFSLRSRVHRVGAPNVG